MEKMTYDNELSNWTFMHLYDRIQGEQLNDEDGNNIRK
jgi:hypothetical protein